MEENRGYRFKSVQDLCFTDDFMFGAVMKDEHICKGVIERLLRIKIDHIEYPELQKTITPFYTRHGVRLDVYVADSDKIYDIEAQTYRQDEAGKRMRYYQSMLDVDGLMKGTDYADLKESYILFLCRYDPFGAELPVYTFERTCRENPAILLGDKTHHVVFNVDAFDAEQDGELRSLLAFLKNNEAKSDFTKEIADMVQTKKFEQTFINEYLAWNLHDRDVERRGREEGITQGLTQGIAQGMQQQAVATARQLRAMNLSAADIAKATGLSVETVKNL